MDLRKEMLLNKKVLGEVLFISVMGIITVVEGLKLIFIKDPAAIYDRIGPGPYLLVVSIMFIGGGIAHLVTHWRKSVGDQRVHLGTDVWAYVPPISFNGKSGDFYCSVYLPLQFSP